MLHWLPIYCHHPRETEIQRGLRGKHENPVLQLQNTAGSEYEIWRAPWAQTSAFLCPYAHYTKTEARRCYLEDLQRPNKRTERTPRGKHPASEWMDSAAFHEGRSPRTAESFSLVCGVLGRSVRRCLRFIAWDKARHRHPPSRPRKVLPSLLSQSIAPCSSRQ